MIRALTAADIPGLNQLPPADWKADYESFLKGYFQEDFFKAFVLIHEGRIVGTGNAFIKNQLGWLANIIVLEEYRGRGLGYQMTQHLIDYIREQGCTTQLLIATSFGEPVYRKAGFQKITTYQRFDSEHALDLEPSPFVRPLTARDWDQVYALDELANGEPRRHLLKKHHGTGLGYFHSNGALLGFYLPDFGRGLVLAKDEAAGTALIQVKHAQKGTRTYLPIDNQTGVTALEKLGIKKGGTSCKMVLGECNSWNPQYIYSYGSGYCG